MLRSALLLLSGLLFVAAPAAADSAAPFLWQVKGPQTTHYLLGSVHLLPKSAEHLPDGIADAYDAADGLVFESDIGALSSPNSGLSLLASAKSARGLKAEIDAATYARLKTTVARLGMPAPLCEQYKPWFCALSLEIFAYQKAGFSGEYGLDRQLYDVAKTDGKRITWFEPPAIHLGLFMNMDDVLGKQLLASALDTDGAAGNEPAELFRAWRDNDVATLETLITETKARYPKVYDHLLAMRNRAWAGKLKTLLDGPESELIVVGAAHWLGPDGLLVQLSKAGYKVSPYVVSNNSELITAAPHGPLMITAATIAGTLPGGR